MVRKFYLESKDFNGIPIPTLSENLNKNWVNLRDTVKKLVNKELVGVINENCDINPHILRIGFPPQRSSVTNT